jgi:hypothetical protein
MNQVQGPGVLPTGLGHCMCVCVSVIWLLGHLDVMSAHNEDEFTNLHALSNNIYGKVFHFICISRPM